VSTPGRPVVYTIGHSTRALEQFLALLGAHGITLLVDLRTVPRSRRHPQFDRATLPPALAGAGIDYAHAPRLGGLRRPRPDSPNTGWRRAGFRGFADHMQSAEFDAALADLIARASQGRLAIMCAEADPRRCHRTLIADALFVVGVTVRHVLGPGHAEPHALTPWARVEGGRVTYPARPGRRRTG
jgi:uncharacterized protein (DUF488 family)